MADRVNYPPSWSADDRASLDVMFRQARAEQKWFYGTYHDLWFTPDELQKAQEDGQFLWGAMNWQLRDPSEYLMRLANKAKEARLVFEDAAKRVAAYYSSLQKEDT